MTKKNRIPPKVSGLVGAGKIGPIPVETVDRMPSFDTDLRERPEEAPGNEDVKFAVEPKVSEVVQTIPVERIQRSQFQNRIVRSSADIADLAENIRTDGLNNPIVVRPTTDGFYELISGETRLQAFVYLGEREIPARIRPMSDLQAARSTVLDNLFHYPLVDYEIYKGFKILLDSGAIPSIRALSRETPYSKSQVHRLMAFSRLPEEAILILENHPDLIGANIAEALAELTGKGYCELVAKALERIRDGSLNQMRAPSWIESQTQERTQPSRRIAAHHNGKPYAILLRAGEVIKITAMSGVDIERLEEAIFDLLKSKTGVFLTPLQSDTPVGTEPEN
jgi:ParB family chromosome partitioning protein